MGRIDLEKDLRRVFAQYAEFLILPVSATEEKGDSYTKLPRSLLAHLILKEDHLLELLEKGVLTLKELREDCEALRELAEGVFKDIHKPVEVLRFAGIPEARHYLYLPKDYRKSAPPPSPPPTPPPAIELASESESPTEDSSAPASLPPRRKELNPNFVLILLGVAALGIAFYGGYIMMKNRPAKSKFDAAPPPPRNVILATPTETATQVPPATPTATEEPPTPPPPPPPPPKPKPRPPAAKPKPRPPAAVSKPVELAPPPTGEQAPVIQVPDEEAAPAQAPKTGGKGIYEENVYEETP